MAKHAAGPAPRTVWDEQESRMARGLSIYSTLGKHAAGWAETPAYAPRPASTHAGIQAPQNLSQALDATGWHDPHQGWRDQYRGWHDGTPAGMAL